jgi:hypothetical protein
VRVKYRKNEYLKKDVFLCIRYTYELYVNTPWCENGNMNIEKYFEKETHKEVFEQEKLIVFFGKKTGEHYFTIFDVMVRGYY